MQDDYRGEVIYELPEQGDGTIRLHQVPESENLILKQGNDEVVMSWDELQELTEFYRGAMDKLEVELAANG